MRNVMNSFCLLLALLMAVTLPANADDKDDEALRKELAEARKELNEAARKVGELTRELGEGFAFRFEEVAENAPRRAMLGISIASIENEGEGEEGNGLRVMSVSPGGPADEAGLESGDILLAIDEVELEGKADGSHLLTAYLDSLEPGTTVTVEYRRGDDEKSVDVTTKAFAPSAFAFRFGPGSAGFRAPMPPMPDMPEIPRAPRPAMFFDMMRGWADMDLVEVSEELGSYFGVDRGLLVVRTPEDSELKLKEGDVILKIGDREPKDVGQALRILRSYSAGDSVELEIVRKGDRQTVSVTVPKSREFGVEWQFSDDEIVVRRDDKVEVETRIVVPENPL